MPPQLQGETKTSPRVLYQHPALLCWNICPHHFVVSPAGIVTVPLAPTVTTAGSWRRQRRWDSDLPGQERAERGNGPEWSCWAHLPALIPENTTAPAPPLHIERVLAATRRKPEVCSPQCHPALAKAEETEGSSRIYCQCRLT